MSDFKYRGLEITSPKTGNIYHVVEISTPINDGGCTYVMVCGDAIEQFLAKCGEKVEQVAEHTIKIDHRTIVDHYFMGNAFSYIEILEEVD